MVDPQVTAAAAEAAVTALCDENSFPIEIFEVEVDDISDGLSRPATSHDSERLFTHPSILLFTSYDATRSITWLFYQGCDITIF